MHKNGSLYSVKAAANRANITAHSSKDFAAVHVQNRDRETLAVYM